MRIVPVLDLQRGRVVRGAGGRRDTYRPVASRLTDSAEPLAVARAFRERFGLTELYLADLDAIAGERPALATIALLRADGFRLWVDAGLRVSDDARALASAGVEGLVAGLETLTGLNELHRLCAEHGSERIVFSLDLKEGRPFGNRSVWGADVWDIAARALACGVRRLIVLDLARVGTAAGAGTEELCSRLVVAYPGVEVTAGGGVRGVQDLRRLRQLGVRGVLVASALHDGRLSREELEVERGMSGPP
jgi:phosphoribosylformimino-5-aminoimidazole carboxamide ribotide isomerase